MNRSMIAYPAVWSARPGGGRLGRWSWRLAILLGGVLAVVPAARARVELVTIPKRDSVQLTIYNSADLTLVKETRLLTFRKGLNRLEFSWANTLIDPTSVEFRPLTHADEIEVVDVSFPPRLTNLLEWRIQSEIAGEAEVEIRYFTSGISWSADYVALADRAQKAMSLAGQVRVANNSGEDYENAQVRLVVGVIHLVENISDLARQGRPGALQPSASRAANAPLMEGEELLRAKRNLVMADSYLRSAAKPAEIVKEGLSEYFLYTVEGRDTIPNGWSKRLPSFQAPEVPLSSYYKFESDRFGNQAMRFYRFKNDEKNRLGKEPLPNGQVMAFRSAADDGSLAFVGQTVTKYVPVNEEVELNLGADAEVMVKPTLMDWEKTDMHFDRNGHVDGWTVLEHWKVELQNSKEIPITVDVRRGFGGDWSLTSDHPHETVDASKVKFLVSLQPREKQSFEYRVTTRFGANVTR